MKSLLKRFIARVVTAMETMHWPLDDANDIHFNAYGDYNRPTRPLDDEGLERPPRRISEERWST